MTEQEMKTEIKILESKIKILEAKIEKVEYMYTYHVEASATITSDLRNMIHDLQNGAIWELNNRIKRLEGR